MSRSPDISRFISVLAKGRSPELADHLGRASETAEVFARLTDCSPEEVEILKQGACLHDIGKVLIPNEILNKPARLTDVEYELVKTHVSSGVKLLDALALDERVMEIVQYHHENYDGSGYPAGLKGKAIPKLAQLMRIVDTFDAITEDRPYHKGLSAAEAIQMLKRDMRFYNERFLETFCSMAHPVMVATASSGE